MPSKLKNGVLDWFGLGPTSITRSVKHPARTRTSTGGMQYKGFKIWRTPEGEYEVPGIEKGTYFDTVGDAKKFINYWSKQTQRNPGMAKKKWQKTQITWQSNNTERISKQDAEESVHRMKAMGCQTKLVKRKYHYKDGQDKDEYSAHNGYQYGVQFKCPVTENPGSPSAGWIRVNAIRQLPSGDIQLALPKGTMSNPGKRKSLMGKIGKVFGKVVGAGKRAIGNPKTHKPEIVSIYMGMSIYKMSPGVYAVLRMDSQARFDSITAAKEYIKEVSKDY